MVGGVQFTESRPEFPKALLSWIKDRMHASKQIAAGSRAP
jgi:hypothetical protein